MRMDKRPIKPKKVWVLRTDCGAILDIVDSRMEYTKKIEMSSPTDAKWEQMNIEDFGGVRVIKEPF